MATLMNGWYKGSIPFYDITEIAVSTHGNGSEMWDGSASLDGSIVCYRTGTKVFVVCDDLTGIGDNAFSKFLALKRVTGLCAITTIGAFAFCYTPNIDHIDIDPDKLTSIGESAFRMSSAEDNLDLSSVPTSIIGDKATRHKRWAANELSAVQSVLFPQNVYMEVPNMESQFAYPDIQYGVKNGEPCYVDTSGCTALACYHIWNAMYAGTELQYDNWLDWYNGVVNKDGTYANNNVFDGNVLPRLVSKIGWSENGKTHVDTVAQLQQILNNLQKGYPTYLSIHSTNTQSGTHAVAVVGCNVNTHKLAIVDSSVLSDRGVVSWVAFEDIFVGGASEVDGVWLFTFNFPVLAPNCTWFTQGGTAAKRKSITEICIKNSYTPTGAVAYSWDASAEKNGGITVYVEGTKLTIAGNGSGKIAANADSSDLFSDPNKSDYFTNLKVINGGQLLDTANANSFFRAFNYCSSMVSDPKIRVQGSDVRAAFQNCDSLTNLDAKNWNLTQASSFQNCFFNCRNLKTLVNLSNGTGGKLTSMQSAFSSCNSLEELDVSAIDVSACTSLNKMLMDPEQSMGIRKIIGLEKWSTANVSNFASVFNGCSYLTELDLSSWDTSKANNYDLTFNNMVRLEKLTLGCGFTNINLVSAGLASPNSDYVSEADGMWHDVSGNSYTPANIPIGKFGVYYASDAIKEADFNERVLVKKGSLLKAASAIRERAGTSVGYAPAEFSDAILEIV